MFTATHSCLRQQGCPVFTPFFKVVDDNMKNILQLSRLAMGSGAIRIQAIKQNLIPKAQLSDSRPDYSSQHTLGLWVRYTDKEQFYGILVRYAVTTEPHGAAT